MLTLNYNSYLGINVDVITVKNIQGLEQQLSQLLIDSVASGASVGFMKPLLPSDALAYWHHVSQELQQGQRKLYLVKEGEDIIGAAQLSLSAKANGSHRGEVEKVMVHRQARGQGLSTKLMQTLEQDAITHGLLLLVLDTRQGDVASNLYRKLGYTEAGTIPHFARSSSGELEATVFFYKQLE